jgi:hypothetical protein
MRRFGRQCRGQSKVVVSVVRQTETQLLTTGSPVGGLARAAQAQGQSAAQLRAEQRPRLATQLTVALAAPQQSTTQSRRLTHGKTLNQGKLVNAYDPTIAPICKGKSNCPTQFGRKPGSIGEPASGFIFAFALPVGNPTDPSTVVPLVPTVQHALTQVSGRSTLALPSLAGDLALNDATLRETLHGRDLLTIGIPHTVEPLSPTPTPEEIRRLRHEAGLHGKRTPPQVQLACACGYRRPIVESLIASLLGRGAARIPYKGQRGATVPIGMTVMAHNAATVVRIQHPRLSTRAQKLRQLLRLKRHNSNEFKAVKN